MIQGYSFCPVMKDSHHKLENFVSAQHTGLDDDRGTSASLIDLLVEDPFTADHAGCKCSDLRGSEQPAAFQEGIETSGPPGAKEGCQGHLAVGALP